MIRSTTIIYDSSCGRYDQSHWKRFEQQDRCVWYFCEGQAPSQDEVPVYFRDAKASDAHPNRCSMCATDTENKVRYEKADTVSNSCLSRMVDGDISIGYISKLRQLTCGPRQRSPGGRVGCQGSRGSIFGCQENRRNEQGNTSAYGSARRARGNSLPYRAYVHGTPLQ